MERLTVLANATPKKVVGRAARRQETETHFESLWKSNSNQFNPERSARERERIERTWNLIQEYSPEGKDVVDLPCGWGDLSVRLKNAGAHVSAADVTEAALNHLKSKSDLFIISKECLPHTTLQDDHFDLVISTDVISYLNPDDFRLYFAELARIIKPDGIMLCSTNVDIYSEDALQRFVTLVETEFEIVKIRLSYHAYQIRLCNILEAPEKFVKGANDKAYRVQELEKRRSFNNLWFKWNSAFIPSLFWRVVNLVASPLSYWFKQSRTLLLALEKVCRWFSSETGISHVIVNGKRRPLFTMPPEAPVFERKHKREVWE